MSLEAMKCPDCGAQLHFSEDQDFCYCSHCGTQVFKSDANSSTTKIQKTIIHKNEARIIEANNRLLELEYKERAQKRKVRLIIAIIVGIVIVVGLIIYGIMRLWRAIGAEGFGWIGYFIFMLAAMGLMAAMVIFGRKD